MTYVLVLRCLETQDLAKISETLTSIRSNIKTKPSKKSASQDQDLSL